MDEAADQRAFPAWALRLSLVLFVLAWIFGPYELRAAVPIWIPFAIALGLELNFLYRAYREPQGAARDRRPQDADRERFGYEDDSELLLVHDGERDLWIPYEGETGEDLEELIAEARDFADAEEEAPAPAAARPQRSLWLPVRRFLTGVGVIAVLGLAAWFVEARTGWDSVSGADRLAAVERFSEEGSRIAGKPVTIRCDESRDYVGFVQHSDGIALLGGDRAYLTPEICHTLYRLAFEDRVDASKTGRAIAVLAHEAWHLRGVADEGATECYALQSGVGLGQRLGLSEDRAYQLMRQQLTENALRGGTTVEYLVPPDCRNGARLDLDPASGRFP